MNQRDRLIELFKKIEYTPFPEMTMKSNLGNQFTDYALNCIADHLIANGVIVPELKKGAVYVVGDNNTLIPITITPKNKGKTIEFRKFNYPKEDKYPEIMRHFTEGNSDRR